MSNGTQVKQYTVKSRHSPGTCWRDTIIQCFRQEHPEMASFTWAPVNSQTKTGFPMQSLNSINQSNNPTDRYVYN
jgi:hypothetical protein